MIIREAQEQDFQQIWPIFKDIVSAGETYGFDPHTTEKQAFQIWMQLPVKTFVCIENDQVLGTYYLKTNNSGPGAHVCNCGYMVSGKARGKGLATSMCEHSQDIARELGYKAMQYNFVASSNEGAVRLWQKLGFDIVGTLPGAFNHPDKGLVDAFVMYKWLDDKSTG